MGRIVRYWLRTCGVVPRHTISRRGPYSSGRYWPGGGTATIGMAVPDGSGAVGVPGVTGGSAGAWPGIVAGTGVTVPGAAVGPWTGVMDTNGDVRPDPKVDVGACDAAGPGGRGAPDGIGTTGGISSSGEPAVGMRDGVFTGGGTKALATGLLVARMKIVS
jgi:hypothetical protein